MDAHLCLNADYELKTNKNYKQALDRLEVIFEEKKGTSAGDELAILGILIDQYENEHFPIDLPDPSKPLNSEWNNLDTPRQIWQKSLDLKVEQVKY